MKFKEMNLKGAYLIETETFKDERGLFVNKFRKNEFEEHGLELEVHQSSISENHKKGTVRGLHFQKDPHSEIKLVFCLKGSFLDVIVDRRKDSPTFLNWESVELKEGDGKMLYIPKNFAHGFQTLEDDTVLFYHFGTPFVPEAYSGLRWNDPKLGINWPQIDDVIINERDNSYALLD